MRLGKASTERSSHALQPLVLACAYFVATAITVRYTRFEGGVAFIWVAGAILFAALVVVERRRWPECILACWLSAVSATAMFGLGPMFAVPLATVNVGEAVLAAWLLKRCCPPCGELKSLPEIAVLLAAAGMIAPAIGAFLSAGVVAHATATLYWPNFLTWYAAHALGAVMLAPPVILAMHGEVRSWLLTSTLARSFEACLLTAATVLVTVGVFAQAVLPLLFLPFLPMMISVFRLGRFGAATSLIVIAAGSSWFTVHGAGPISHVPGGPGFHAQLLQLYLVTAVLMVLPAASDLTRRKQTVRELEEHAALHRLILDRTGDVIMTLELEGAIRFASASSSRVLGLEPEALIGIMPQSLIHPDDVDAVVAVQRQVLEEPERTFTVEYRIVVDGREVGWFETHARAMLRDDGRPNGAVVIIRDVSDRKEAERCLTAAAMTDPLTGVANRRAFDAALTGRLSAISPPKPAAVALFDLDHFKAVNDEYGHATGDAVLHLFATLLKNGVRDSDVVARFGGEEFVAIVEGDLDAARAVVERVRLRFAASTLMASDGRSVAVTVSAGIAAIPPRGDAPQVLARADAALYRAKAGGRNRLVLAS